MPRVLMILFLSLLPAAYSSAESRTGKPKKSLVEENEEWAPVPPANKKHTNTQDEAVIRPPEKKPTAESEATKRWRKVNADVRDLAEAAGTDKVDNNLNRAFRALAQEMTSQERQLVLQNGANPWLRLKPKQAELLKWHVSVVEDPAPNFFYEAKTVGRPNIPPDKVKGNDIEGYRSSCAAGLVEFVEKAAKCFYKMVTAAHCISTGKFTPSLGEVRTENIKGLKVGEKSLKVLYASKIPGGDSSVLCAVGECGTIPTEKRRPLAKEPPRVGDSIDIRKSPLWSEPGGYYEGTGGMLLQGRVINVYDSTNPGVNIRASFMGKGKAQPGDSGTPGYINGYHIGVLSSGYGSDSSTWPKVYYPEMGIQSTRNSLAWTRNEFDQNCAY